MKSNEKKLWVFIAFKSFYYTINKKKLFKKIKKIRNL
jgi:hypothetical protein